jgi:hypothetical protein
MSYLFDSRMNMEFPSVRLVLLHLGCLFGLTVITAFCFTACAEGERQIAQMTLQ